jgi:hypothetical protein
LKRIVPVIIALFAAVMIFLFRGALNMSASSPAEPINLPESWQEYHRTFLQEANEAILEFTRQHLKNIPIRSGARAGYENGENSFELWVATGAGDAHAAQMVQDMTAKIGKAHALFSEPQPVDLGPIKGYHTHGQEKENYYFVKGSKVYWVGVNRAPDPQALAARVAQEL